MGFMGMGYQKWIYTQRPRKPFSRERKPLHTKIANSPSKPYTFTPGKSTEKPKRKITFFSFLAILSLFFVVSVVHLEWRKLVAYHNQVALQELTKKQIDPEIFIRKYIKVRIRRGHWDYAQEDIDFLRANHPKSQETEYLNVLLLHKKANNRKDTMRAKEMMIRHILTYPKDTSALRLIKTDSIFYSEMDY